ncbi:hypothetical protein L249_0096, partial [Ophiocordyceps polyrhachis-furcata BCC 54312]
PSVFQSSTLQLVSASIQSRRPIQVLSRCRLLSHSTVDKCVLARPWQFPAGHTIRPNCSTSTGFLGTVTKVHGYGHGGPNSIWIKRTQRASSLKAT